MVLGLGSIVDRVTGLLGKTYLLAGFLPVLLLTAVSLLVGHHVSAWVHGRVEALRGMDAASQALASGALLSAVAVLGFVFWSANPWWRAIFEGSVVPRPLREHLVQNQRRRLGELEAAIDRCEDRVFAFRIRHPERRPEPDLPGAEPAAPGPWPERVFSALLARRTPPEEPPAPAGDEPDWPAEPPTWVDRLAAARAAGTARRDPPLGPPPPLFAMYERLAREVRSLGAVEAGTLDDFCTAMEDRLSAGPVTPGSEPDRLHARFVELADLARARAEHDRNRAISERRIRFPDDLATVGPTRLANAAALYRDGALVRYGMDPEVFWLHLQRAASADEQFRPIIEEARLKLEISVAMAMACALASAGTIGVALRGHSIPLLLLTALFPIAAVLFYNAAVTNLRVYGRVVSATVDLFRFEVLRALHLPLPSDSAAERRLWEGLTLSNQLLAEHGVTYAHP
jgi:hypothetical protein